MSTTTPSQLTASVIDVVTDWLADLREQSIEWTDRVSATTDPEVVAAGRWALADIEHEVSMFVEAMLKIGAGVRNEPTRIEVDDRLTAALGDLCGASDLCSVIDGREPS